MAAALAAGAAIRRAGVELAGTLEYHLVADEELAGTHGTQVLWDRGLLDVDAAIVGEPSELQLGLAERGGAWITLTAHGRAAHGSQPHRGVNAITSMARYLLRLPEVLPDLEHPLTGRPTVNAALIAGGSAPNVVPDRCDVDVDRRIVPGETDPDAVLAPFRAARRGAAPRRSRRAHRGLDPRVDRSGRGLLRHGPRPHRPHRRKRRDRGRTGPRGLHRHHGRAVLHQRGADPHGDPGARLADGRAHGERVRVRRRTRRRRPDLRPDLRAASSR